MRINMPPADMIMMSCNCTYECVVKFALVWYPWDGPGRASCTRRVPGRRAPQADSQFETLQNLPNGN